ncbi:hypothetical protein DH2020_039503 [Rehmannia glutinosa]|uniref:G protein gamma domain-containing protein n=1 Tax=Rehmannia glutinosa TaxID=99300 RepID=A0ABR0UVN8_REHGL
MSGLKGNSSVPSLPPPQPKSPPEYPDLYGKRRELAKVQMLEREISFLEEELKSIEGLQLASRSCKEVADFVIANADPLIPTTKKIRRSCRFWKWLWFHGYAVVVVARLVLRHHAAVTVAVYVTVAATRAQTVECQNATVSHAGIANAVRKPNVASIVAAPYRSVLLAQLALAQAVHVILNVLSSKIYVHVVTKAAATLATFVISIT